MMLVFHANKKIVYNVLTKINVINAKMDIIYLKVTVIRVLNFVKNVHPPLIVCSVKTDTFIKLLLKVV